MIHNAVPELGGQLGDVDVWRQLHKELFDVPAPVVHGALDKAMGIFEKLPGANEMNIAELGGAGQVFVDAADAGGHFGIDGDDLTYGVDIAEKRLCGGGGEEDGGWVGQAGCGSFKQAEGKDGRPFGLHEIAFLFYLFV